VTTAPAFRIVGAEPRVPVPFKDIASDHAFLWDCYDKVYGKRILTTNQNIGSCVGHGGYNAMRGIMACDIFFRKDRETPVELFEPYGYGRSRTRAGIRGSGSGSTGSGFAEAAYQDGVLRRDFQNKLSGWRESGNTIDWSGSVDTQWSNGANIGQEYLAEGRLHVTEKPAQATSADMVREAMQQYRTVTIASNWGGLMQCPVKEGVLLNRRSGSWAHQMSVHGWMLHNSLGELYYVWNSWSADCHGVCPTGAPLGGFWVSKSDMQNIVSQDDSWIFPGLTGYAARKVNHRLG